MGVVYPAYASFKAVELLRVRHDSVEASRWLTYWAVFGTLAAAERILDRLIPYVPYYPTVKLALLLWLQSPRYGGATRLARRFAYPLLARAHPHIDAFLEALKMWAARPEVAAAAATLHEVCARIPVVEWFVRGPDGRPLPPPSRAPRPADGGFGGFLLGR